MHNVKDNIPGSPIITFDKPLWWKAQLIVESEPPDSEQRSIILRLGGLHVEMSFLGCIGSIMSGSGIEELLECVHASNTVGHMLRGKAVQRACRGHEKCSKSNSHRRCL